MQNLDANPQIQADGTVSRIEFARLINRNPSQVTRWVQANKLSGAALSGTRIVVQAAMAQLKLTLDPAQQISQAASPVFSPAQPPQAAFQQQGYQPPPQTPPAGEISARPDTQDRYLAAKAESAELAAAKARREEMQQTGQWIERSSFEGLIARQAGDILRAIESDLTLIAEAVVEMTGCKLHDAVIGARRGFRKIRARLAESLDAEARVLESDEADPRPDAHSPQLEAPL